MTGLTISICLSCTVVYFAHFFGKFNVCFGHFCLIFSRLYTNSTYFWIRNWHKKLLTVQCAHHECFSWRGSNQILTFAETTLDHEWMYLLHKNYTFLYVSTPNARFVLITAIIRHQRVWTVSLQSLWKTCLVKIPTKCPDHKWIGKRSVFQKFCKWCFCHSNNAGLAITFRNSFWVCFYECPRALPLRQVRSFWIPIRRQSKRWNVGWFCRTRAREEIATIEWVRQSEEQFQKLCSLPLLLLVKRVEKIYDEPSWLWRRRQH